MPASDPAPSAEDLPDAGEDGAPPNSQSSSKENDEPTDIAASRPPAPAPAVEVDHAHQPVPPTDHIETEPGTLPPELLSLYQSSTRILEHDFSQSPPYTIQRLAELVLHPKKHYRFLPAYLRALDRVVSVSSPVSDFPLPTLQHAALNGGFLTNGDSSQVNGNTARGELGSDESLGGALLTPIPWLRTPNNALTGSTAANGHDGELHSESTETIEGPNGAGSVETVSVTVNGVSSASSVANTSQPASPTLSEQSDASSSSSAESAEAQLRQQGGVTQGELLRQEQEAGVVPVSQLPPRRAVMSGMGAAVGLEPVAKNVPRDTAADVVMEDSRPPEETPHARGPEMIGMEDMGPQHRPIGGGHGLDMDAAVGRSKSPPQPAQTGPPPPVTTQQQVREVPRAVVAEAQAKAAAEDDSGAPGKDPQDVEKEVEQLKEAMDEEKVEEAKDDDGDVVLADADGRAADEAEKLEVTGDLSGADAADTTTL